MKILLTGITGLVGWNFWLYSKKYIQEQNLFAVANKKYPELKQYQNTIFYHKISDFEEISETIQKIKPDIIIHAAGICDLDVCEFRKKDTHLINVEGTRALLEASGKIKLSHFIYISCDHVFSGDHPPYNEKSKTDPISVYGKTRVLAEELVKKSNLKWTILRAALPVGVSLQGNTGPLDWFQSRTFNKKRADYFLDEKRSVLFAEDIARAIWKVVKKRTTGLYHLGGPKTINRFELAQIFTKVFPGTQEYIFGRYRRDEKNGPPRVGDVILDSKKARKDFGFDPRPVTVENVRKVVSY